MKGLGGKDDDQRMMTGGRIILSESQIAANVEELWVSYMVIYPDLSMQHSGNDKITAAHLMSSVCMTIFLFVVFR